MVANFCLKDSQKIFAAPRSSHDLGPFVFMPSQPSLAYSYARNCVLNQASRTSSIMRIAD